MASEVDGELEPDPLGEGELEEPPDEELLEEDDLGIDELVAEDLVDEEELGDVADADAVVAEGEEPLVELEEDEDELDDDDVEASLDVILKERLVVSDETDEEDDSEAADAEDRVDGTTRVLPKQPGEFVCQSCFLVKSQTQLADRRRKLCRDCV
ncbi:MAG: DUF4193 family protein [Acidimicrobiales bacterium]